MPFRQHRRDAAERHHAQVGQSSYLHRLFEVLPSLASHGYQTTTFAHSTIVSGTCFGDNALNSERSEKRLIGTSTRRAKGHHRRDRKHPAVIAPNDLPVALVHHPVMPVAEKGEGGRLVVPPMEPVLQMVVRGPTRPPLAPRPRP